MQDVLDVDRQQRHGAAQQHREQIQRHGAQHHLALHDEVHAGQQRGHRHRLARRRRVFAANRRAQVPGRTRQVVHLPAHCHQQHLAGGGAGQARVPKALEGRVLEQLGAAGHARSAPRQGDVVAWWPADNRRPHNP